MSCLFRSLGVYENETPSRMRQVICDFMASDPELNGRPVSTWVTELQPDKNLESYVRQMRLSRTWGGALEIMCYATIFNTRAVVKHGTDQVIEFLSPEGSFETAVLHWTGAHYTAVYKSKICPIVTRSMTVRRQKNVPQ